MMNNISITDVSNLSSRKLWNIVDALTQAHESIETKAGIAQAAKQELIAREQFSPNQSFKTPH